MCTVTFIPVKERVFITSNRDENHGRATAMVPALYTLRKSNVLFPKDKNAGGTWFAVDEDGDAIVFLNGGFQKHIPHPPYRKSRGLILLDMIDEKLPVKSFLEIELDNIEPFTAIIWQNQRLFDCRWDGQKKYHVEVDNKVPHIWSSVTLYDESIISKRRQWFEKWITKNPTPSQDDILHFHQFTGDGDAHNDLLMNRNNEVMTVSITSASFTNDKVFVKYIDVRNLAGHTYDLLLNKEIVEK